MPFHIMQFRVQFKYCLSIHKMEGYGAYSEELSFNKQQNTQIQAATSTKIKC